MKVINLYGGPGSGKSTTAAGLFFKMKSAGYRVELIPEAAKFFEYSGTLSLMPQRTLFDMQRALLGCVAGKVDYVITDSPILLGMAYIKPFEDSDDLRRDILAEYAKYDNVNIFIRRVKPYQRYGRSQSEEQACVLDSLIRGILKGVDEDYGVVAGNSGAPQAMLKYLEYTAAAQPA